MLRKAQKCEFWMMANFVDCRDAVTGRRLTTQSDGIHNIMTIDDVPSGYDTTLRLVTLCSGDKRCTELVGAASEHRLEPPEFSLSI